MKRYNKAMYLISLYFDEKTNQIIQSCMKCAADASGNTDMLDHEVPPHITLSVFESRATETELVEKLDELFLNGKTCEIMWVSVAAFFPRVLYLVPVLGRDLHELTLHIYEAIEGWRETHVQEYYRPFNCQPHTTVARKMTQEEMRKAFEGLQRSFVPFRGKAVRVGLSEGTLKREIKSWSL